MEDKRRKTHNNLNKTILPHYFIMSFFILEILILLSLKGFKIGFVKPLTKNKAQIMNVYI